jgi:bacterioferritin-associated ferredoxin
MSYKDEIICNCMQITRSEIEDAIKQGYDSLEKIQDKTEAGTVCGICVEDIVEILKEHGK